MEIQKEKIGKQRALITWVVLLAGLAIILFACLFMSVGIYLDVFGAEATGEITNKPQQVSNDSGQSFNPEVTFTTSDGHEISFTPYQRMSRYQQSKLIRTGDILSYFQMSGLVFSGDLMETIDTSIEVSYLEAFPRLAKINFAYHIEYYRQAAWLFWGLMITTIGLLIKRGKSSVIDLRKNKTDQVHSME